MNCCIAFCLIFFVLPNLALLLVGGFMAACSLVALFYPSLLLPAYKAYFHELYADVFRSSADRSVDSCYNDNWSASDQILVIDWMQIPLAKYILCVLAGLGGWLFFWSFWALVSLSRCCHKCSLVFYTIIQIVGLVGLPVILLLAYVPFKAQLLGHLEHQLNSTMERDYYARPDKTCTSFKLAFDAIQYQGYCCAVDGYAPDTDERLAYSPVCSAGTLDQGKDSYQSFPGCLAVIRQFIDKELLLWLGIAIGVVCLLFLLEIITGLVCVGLWRRSSRSERSHNYLASERDGFISDKDMEQYYAPGQFSAPNGAGSSHHSHHRRK